METVRQRDIRYDLLRILACFAVVMLHVSNSYWYSVDTGSGDFIAMTLYNSPTRFAVPVFFMMSGAFLLNPSKEITVKQMLGKVARLTVTFLIWSSFYAFQSIVLHIVRGGLSSVTSEMWQDGLTRLLTGHGPMWFLLDLIGFYLLTPILRKMCEDMNLVRYFLFLWVLVRFILQILLPALNLMTVYALMNNLHLNALTGYIGYYVGGYYLMHAKFSPKIRYAQYAAGAVSLVLSAVLTLTTCRSTGEYDDHLFEPSNILVLLFSAAVFMAFSNMKQPNVTPKTEKVILGLSKLTFFVYLAHPFFIEKLNLLGVNTLSFTPVLSIPVLWAAITALCLACGWIIRKIPFLGRWITYQ